MEIGDNPSTKARDQAGGSDKPKTRGVAFGLFCGIVVVGDWLGAGLFFCNGSLAVVPFSGTPLFACKKIKRAARKRFCVWLLEQCAFLSFSHSRAAAGSWVAVAILLAAAKPDIPHQPYW